MMFTINKDGSFDINAGGIAITGAYPEINGIPLRPLSVEVLEDRIRYSLVEGVLEVRFGKNSITALAEGMPAVHDISPIGCAVVSGCTKGFRQGYGIAGPSGFVDICSTFESDALVAIGGAECCLTIHAKDNRRFRVHYSVDSGRLNATVDIENTCCGDFTLPEMYIATGDDFNTALRACARDIAGFMGARTPKKAAFHWCSWYYLYHCLDQATIEEYVAGFNEYRDIAPFSHIQIDAGYFPSCGDWLEYHPRFPGGLKQAAQTIKDAGYEPGIWIGPFMVGDESKLFKEHPDWMLKSTDGTYVSLWRQYNEPKPWGYRDSDYYVLDTSHPDAMEYIVGVFRTLKEWGYTLYKTDFLLWGMHDSSKVVRHTPGKTSFEYFRELMQNIRQAIGEDSAWLGCIAPFMPAIGYVDMMRIAGDVGAQWDDNSFGPTNMIQEIHADQYFNNVYWQNDPDAVLLRDFHIHLEYHQVEALAIMQAISGGVITTSDPIHQIAPDRRRLLELIRPAGVTDSRFPAWDEQNGIEIITADTDSGKLAFFFNTTSANVTCECDWVHILGDDDWQLFRLHGSSAPAAKVPCLTIPAQSGVLFFASREELKEEPRNMWKW